MDYENPIYMIWYNPEGDGARRRIVVGVYYGTRLYLVRLEVTTDNRTGEL